MSQDSVCMLHHSALSDSAAPWTVARQAPLSMEFSRRECWSGLPCPSQGDLPDAGFERTSLLSPALAGGFFTTGNPWEAPEGWWDCLKLEVPAPCFPPTLRGTFEPPR